MRKTNLRIAAIVLLIATDTLTLPSAVRASTTRTTPAGAAEPLKDIDWEHVGEYRRWLNRSTNPRAVAFRRAIAHGPEELAKAKALARKAGMPLTLAELQPSVPLAENAASLYQKWKPFERTDPVASWTIEYVNPLANYPLVELDAARKEMLRNRSSLDLLHHAAGLPHYIPTRNPKLDNEIVDMNILSRMREASRELNEESYIRFWTDGRYDEAINDTTLDFRLSAQAEDVSLDLIGYLTAEAIASLPLQTLRDYLYLAGPNQHIDELIQRALRRDWPRMDIQRAVAGDALSDFHFFDGILEKLSGESSDVRAVWWPSAETARRRILAGDQEFASNLVALLKANALRPRVELYLAAARPFPDLLPALERASRVKNPVALPIDLAPLGDVSVMGSVGFIAARRTAEKDVVLTAAAVLCYEARNSTLPATLLDAMPDAPTSPFDGKPYFYQKTAKGFLISVVPPGQPISGAPKNMKSRPIEFRYPAPAELRKTPESYAEYLKQPHWPGELPRGKTDLWGAFDNLPKR